MSAKLDNVRVVFVEGYPIGFPHRLDIWFDWDNRRHLRMKVDKGCSPQQLLETLRHTIDLIESEIEDKEI